MNLQSTIDLDLKGFFQWWGRELVFLIPHKIRQFLSDRNAVLTYSASATGFCVSYQTDNNSAPSLFSQDLSFEDKAGFQALKNQYPDVDKAEAVLRLNAGQALAKIIYLPEAALENLQQVAGFELDRYTPFKIEDVYYAVVSLGKTGLGQIQVLLLLSPKLVLDELLAQLIAWEVQPVRVEFEALNSQYPELQGKYNLLPAHYRPSGNNLAKSVHWLLNGLIVLLLSAGLGFPVWMEKQEVELIKSELKDLEKQTRVVEAQQLEIDALREETQKLIDIKQLSPDMLAALSELTHVLKDDTYLTNLQFTEKHMQIQGQSPGSSALIGILEESPYFSKVSFVSPLTQDKVTGLERFQIGMDVDPKPRASTSATQPVQSAPLAAPPLAPDTETGVVEEQKYE